MIAIVTGGGSGIGRAVSERLRNAGADVVVWDLEDGDIACDISDPESVVAAVEQTVAGHGTPDRLVACAGVGASGLLLDQNPKSKLYRSLMRSQLAHVAQTAATCVEQAAERLDGSDD